MYIGLIGVIIGEDWGKRGAKSLLPMEKSTDLLLKDGNTISWIFHRGRCFWIVAASGELGNCEGYL